MAIGWLTVLKSVPWSEVIGNAPVVADGARKLWNAVAGKPVAQEIAEANQRHASTHETVAALEARIASMEAAASELHGQMLASSELIKELADQNTQLIARMEQSRVRMLWLSGAAAFSFAVALGALAIAVVALMQRGAG